ncbi:Putative uncharacterized transposon-derived protein, partial [Frankliniella fusca]
RETRVVGGLWFRSVATDRRPTRLFSDKGKEYINKTFQKSLKENNITYIHTHNPDIKCSIMERWQRTIKSKLFKRFTYTEKYRYVDGLLDDIVDAYNHTYHRSIKMRPVDVTPDRVLEVYNNLYCWQANSKFKCTVLLSLLGDRAGVPPGTPQPRAVYIGQAAIGGGDGESAATRPHWSASAQRCNQARSVPGDGSRIQEGSGRSVTFRSPETTADGCRISGGPGLDETPLQAEEGPGQLQRWGSEPGSVARTEGGGVWEADDRGWHGSALSVKFNKESKC